MALETASSRNAPGAPNADDLRGKIDRVGAIIVRGVLAAMRPRIVEALSATLEPGYAVEPDLQIQRNSFPLVGKRGPFKLFGLIGPGWHHDSGDERANRYLFDDDYRMVKCGLYLQDNSEELGGSIDIAPGSHRRLFLTGRNSVDFYLQRVRQNVGIVTGWRSLDIKAGDFVAFDSWLSHRGTIPRGYLDASEVERRKSYVDLPPEKTKFAIYYNASRRRLARTYVQHCLKRGQDDLAPRSRATTIRCSSPTSRAFAFPRTTRRNSSTLSGATASPCASSRAMNSRRPSRCGAGPCRASVSMTICRLDQSDLHGALLTW